MKRIVIWLLFCLALNADVRAAPSRASSASGGKTFYFGTGAMLYNMGKVTSSDDASTSLIGQFYIPLNLSVRLPIAANMSLVPSITYTPLGSTATDSINKKILTLGANANIDMGVLDLKGGIGLMLYSIKGPGGSITRANGTSTATFYLPSSTQTSKSIFLDIGAGMALPSDFRIDLDLIAVSALSSRRAITSTILISKGFF